MPVEVSFSLKDGESAQRFCAGNDEESYYIHRSSIAPEPTPLLKPAVKVAADALFLWLVPLPFFYIFVGDFHFWRDLALFFTKTAFVTIGGWYTVIPYVAKVAVTKPHWLNKSQMTDGFALAETTPGPLIIVVAFVGFLAAYNHFHGSLWMGTLGLLATTFYTFLPCFFFVFAGAPLIERTQGKRTIEGLLALITAVVVGAILDLTLFLGKNGDLVIRSCGSQANQSTLSGLGDAVVSPAPEIQTEDHSADPAGYWVRFDAVFSRLVKNIRQDFRLVASLDVVDAV
jgi:chromate transport protein ChrA